VSRISDLEIHRDPEREREKVEKREKMRETEKIEFPAQSSTCLEEEKAVLGKKERKAFVGWTKKK